MDSIVEQFENNTIDPASLPKFEEAEFHPVLKQYLVKRNITSTITVLIFSGAWVGFWIYNNNFSFLTSGLVVLMLLLGFRIWNNIKLQQNLGYSLREKDILFRRGFIVSRITVIPFNRIQHATISRDVLDKFLGIASLEIFTAGGSGSDISIPGLPPELAKSLKESLAVKLSQDET